jgi:thiamine-phosphate pyrophosphorylase
LKRYIYLISPQKISNSKFYSDLNQVLRTKKIKYFQLRLKNKPNSVLIKIAKKIKKITNKNKVKLLINDKPFVAKIVNADGCHIGQKDMSFIKTRKILEKKKLLV